MKRSRKILLVIGALLATLAGLFLLVRLPDIPVPSRGAVLEHVTVVNPGRDRRPNQAITIVGSRIASIGESRNPGAAQLYALPGLIDMHVHHPFASGLAGISGDTRLFDILFLAHG